VHARSVFIIRTQFFLVSAMKNSVIPVLDMQDLRAGGERRRAFLAKLAEAARTVGFFYIAGHELDTLQGQTFRAAKAFFQLPLEQKLTVEMLNSPHFRGYTRLQGELTQGKPDFREQFDVMREEPALSTENAPRWTQLIGPNQWPSALPELEAHALAYQEAQTELTQELLMAFAESLGLNSDAFGESIHKPYVHMKLMRYPGAEHEQQAGGQGVGAHKDPGYLTIVTQDQQSGLQVEMDGKGWVDVPPLEGAVVVNIGELLELASNGYLRATNHRVLTPPAGTSRFSIAFFMAAQLDSEVPLLALSEAQRALALGPASDPNNPLFSQVGKNVLKGRMRSHPDVAAKFQVNS